MDYNKNSENAIILTKKNFELIFNKDELRRLFFQSQFKETFKEEDFNEMVKKFDNLKFFIENNAKINENGDYIIPKNNKKIIDGVNDYLQYLDKNPKLAMFFIRLGVDIEKIKTEDGKTALHLAAIAKDEEIAKYLIENKKMDINVKDNNGKTPFFYGFINNDNNSYINLAFHYIVKEVLDKKIALDTINENDESIVHYMIKNYSLGDYTDIRLINNFINFGCVDVNAKNKEGQTLLHYAAEKLLIYQNIEQYNIDALKLIKNLVKRGADINAKDNNGNTLTSILKNGGLIKENLEELEDLKLEEWSKKVPFYTIIRGDLELAKDIIDSKKLDIKELTMNGKTLMHCAAKYNNTEAIEYLADKGLDVDAKDKDDKTALYYAIKYGKKEAIELLISKGADLSIAENSTINSIILDKNEKIIKKAIKTLKKIKKDYDQAKDSIKIKQIKEVIAYLKESIEPEIENTQSI